MNAAPRPMLASLSEAPLSDPSFVYEPKYDGIRAIAEVSPGYPTRLWSRLGNEKSSQFPEIVETLTAWSRRLKAPVILDGEIVALDSRGEPAGFQNLQNRIHLAEQSPQEGRVAFIVFDLLREGSRDLRARPLRDRRAELERVLDGALSPRLRLSEIAFGDGRELYTRALASGWEGLIVKRVDSKYQSGKRTPDWRKLKIVREQEFVVGGWTEPRRSREYFGALLLGVYGDGRLTYVGHTGTGFDHKELDRLMHRLEPLETAASPFHVRPKTNERPHWVEPKLVVQVKFTEWTDDGKLRHPVYLGLRDDKKPKDVIREESRRLHSASERLKRTAPAPPTRPPKDSAALDALEHELLAIEQSRKPGVITLPGGDRLTVSNLHKVFWPAIKLTKGDLMRYYVKVAPMILPAVEDRPLIMKRFPNGIEGEAFYQQRAPDDVPQGVRVERVSERSDAADRQEHRSRKAKADDGNEIMNRLVGGNLTTLLYMAQLAAISQDPWFSTVTSPGTPDFVALDLDPMPDVPFSQVLDVARWIHDELQAIGIDGVPKTSGADGLHIYIPLPRGTPYETGLLACQILATIVAEKHPRSATVERSVKTRGRTVYVDYLQNIRGKSIAMAYSARASAYAGVSTPLSWKEVDAGIDREDFNLRTVPDRVKQVGDLWKRLRTSKGIDLSRIARYAASEGTRTKATPKAPPGRKAPTPRRRRGA